ncbi:MAG TPA: hypothetical protein DCQ28_04005 [Bacteroidetes bacterium]|nr:hypothetical protein [Bacteroidota bacterium]
MNEVLNAAKLICSLLKYTKFYRGKKERNSIVIIAFISVEQNKKAADSQMYLSMNLRLMLLYNYRFTLNALIPA